MRKIRFLTFVCIFFVVEIVNAQQQVSKEEAINAAINTLYNKEEVLRMPPDTEVETVFSFSNERHEVLMYEIVFKIKKGTNL